ncbi:coiled-coil domain-containing protein [Cucumibacter marinus]|uniref:hypothetical protein n=1 Tax=Cucumibacter marinus TaxID=1121252 RepID=UPI00041503B7|nr:hypothetical protein [Cucumibacter marinus]
MLVENVMYFALGFLAAGVLALMIMPSIWRRAVRLTKKRIEAATPMTLAEFRADKDQLRAEFAMSTRRLEMNVEALRKRLGDQLEGINRKKAEVTAIKADRDEQLQIIRELEDREETLRKRVNELERDSADLSHRLRQRERDLSEKINQLNSSRAGAPRQTNVLRPEFRDAGLSGEYAQDVEDLLHALDAERGRADFLEEQAQVLMQRVEAADRQSASAQDAVRQMRDAIAEREAETEAATSELTQAETRMANAESQLNALLEDASRTEDPADAERQLLLAEKLSLEEELEKLRGMVGSVETTILNEWASDRIQEAHLRERLNDIAAEVSKLIYAVDGDPAASSDESLFDKVRKYAGDGVEVAELSSEGHGKGPREGDVSSRMEALRDLRPSN